MISISIYANNIYNEFNTNFHWSIHEFATFKIANGQEFNKASSLMIDCDLLRQILWVV